MESRQNLTVGKKKFRFPVPNILKSKTALVTNGVASVPEEDSIPPTDLHKKTESSLFSRLAKSKIGSFFRTRKAGSSLSKISLVEQPASIVALAPQGPADTNTLDHKSNVSGEASAELKEQTAAIKIQACFRGFREKRKYNAERRRIIKVQTLARGFLVRRNIRKLKAVSQSTPNERMDENNVEPKEDLEPLDISKELIETELTTIVSADT